MKGLIKLMELLDTEGFTPYVASLVRKYAIRKATEGQKSRYIRTRKAFSAIMKTLSEGDRKIVGGFINTLQSMALDAGMKIGLGARLVVDETQGESND